MDKSGRGSLLVLAVLWVCITAFMATGGRADQGPPTLGEVTDAGNATAHLTWSNSADPPAQFLGFAYDIYASEYVAHGWQGTLWYPFSALATSGDIYLGLTGAYHVWISSQYFDGAWYACSNPWAGAMYSGTPHTPAHVVAQVHPGAFNVRLSWKPEIYGTWHYQIVAYNPDSGFIPTTGPSGEALWHFVDYSGTAYIAGRADFFQGWADFSLAPGSYWFCLRATGWSEPYPAGEFGMAFIQVQKEGARTFYLPGNVPLTMVRIPAGSFAMGSPDSERGRLSDEGPVHAVDIGYDYYLGQCQLTQGQWQAVMGVNPVTGGDFPVANYGVGDNYPVYQVSWDECQQLISALNALGLGGTFRLPSEAEGEYACRAATQTRFFFGDSLAVDDEVSDGPAGILSGNRSDYMWWIFNESENTNGQFGRGTHPVGAKRPNPWGLYDMSGNMWEWRQDWYHTTYSGAPADGSAWESQQSGYPFRVTRGGCWNHYAAYCRSACRSYGSPVYHYGPYIGVRLAWTPD